MGSLLITSAWGWSKTSSPERRRSVGAMSANKDVYQKAKKLLQEARPAIPKLVVVDLDYTIWPFWCDMYTTRDVDIARLFPETLEILDALKDSDVKLAVASRSPTLDVAHTFLRKVGIFKGYFETMVIVPYVNKDKKHFPGIRKQLGIEYEDMMFFDDEQLQYRVVGNLGVTSILVSTSSGLCLQSFRKGLGKFAERKQR